VPALSRTKNVNDTSHRHVIENFIRFGDGLLFLSVELTATRLAFLTLYFSLLLCIEAHHWPPELGMLLSYSRTSYLYNNSGISIK